MSAASPASCPTVILCGGLGMRLREETEHRPKPLIEIAGRPILWHIMKLYSAYGYRRFVLCLGYRGVSIKEYFLNFERITNDLTVYMGPQREVRIETQDDPVDWEVTLADTGLTTNTGGRLKRVARYLGEQTFMVTYGDGVADIDLSALMAFHRREGRLATVTGLRPVSRFGVLETNGNQHVVSGFREKPRLDGLVSGGFFVFEPRVLEYLTDDCVLERDVLPRLAADGQLAVYCHEGFWKSLDTYRDYQEFNQMVEEGHTPWTIW